MRTAALAVVLVVAVIGRVEGHTSRSTASIRRIMAGLAPVHAVVQACSFASSIALARVLGADAATDAYYLGLAIPVAVYAVLLVAFRLGAIPALRAQDDAGEAAFGRAASELVSATLVCSAVVSVVVSALAVAAVPAMVPEETARIARTVILQLAPLGVLGALTGALGAVLAVRGIFAVAVAVMAVEPLLKTVLTFAFGAQIGINALILGNLVGSALAAGILWRRAHAMGIRLVLTRPFGSTFVAGVLSISIPLLVSQAVLQANPIVDRSMAGALGAGSVTAFEIGLRLAFVPTAFVTGLLITPVAATWAERRLREGWPGLRASVARAVAAIATFVPPLVVLGIVLRREVVALAYQGGAYSGEALEATTTVFAITLLAVPAQLVTIVFSTLFVIEGAMLVPMAIGIANVVLNLGLNFALRPVLGVAGIALSTTLTVAVLTAVYVAIAQRRWHAASLQGRARPVGVALASSALVALVAASLARALPEAASRVDAFLVVLLVGGTGIAVHAAVLLGREPSTRFVLRVRGAVARGSA